MKLMPTAFELSLEKRLKNFIVKTFEIEELSTTVLQSCKIHSFFVEIYIQKEMAFYPKNQSIPFPLILIVSLTVVADPKRITTSV